MAEEDIQMSDENTNENPAGDAKGGQLSQVTFYLHSFTSGPGPMAVVVRPEDLRGIDSYEWNDPRAGVYQDHTCPASGLYGKRSIGDQQAAERGPRAYVSHRSKWFTKIRFHSRHSVTICENCATELLRRLGRQDLLVNGETYLGCQHSGTHPPCIDARLVSTPWTWKSW